MAQDVCLTEGDKKWKSKLIPTGGAEKDDGKIEITKVSNQLRGKHEKSGADLENLDCNGTDISFDRLETRADGSKIRVFYKNGKITGPTGGKYFINGKYEEKDVTAPLAGKAADTAKSRASTKGKAGLVLADTGDWQAEKPSS